jgi:hypothetical protein
MPLSNLNSYYVPVVDLHFFRAVLTRARSAGLYAARGTNLFSSVKESLHSAEYE